MLKNLLSSRKEIKQLAQSLETKVKERTAELAHSETRQRIILTASPNAMVAEAADGQSGLEEFKKSKENNELFELVLLDCHMPGMDGFEATREIRNAELRMRNEKKQKFRIPHSAFRIPHSALRTPHS